VGRVKDWVITCLHARKKGERLLFYARGGRRGKRRKGELEPSQTRGVLKKDKETEDKVEISD